MKRLAVLSLAALLAGAVAWACGPFLPNFILGPDEAILDGPHGILTAELARPGEEKPAFRAVPAPDDDPAAQTAQEDLAETRKILQGLGTPPERSREILGRLQALREGLARLDADRTEGGEEARDERPPVPDPASLAVPAGLPDELALYLEGALAWHLGRGDRGQAAWTRLLALPEAERRHRSTWAAFMLGKSALGAEPGEAVRFFQLTRELAEEGFADSLGLAASSLGWEARAELGQEHPEKALALYQRQWETGDPGGLNSIRAVSSELLASADSAPLERVARDPAARAIVNAYVVSRDTAAASAWLKALESAGVTDQQGADRIAWIAYLAGDFEQARAWLDRAPESSPMARWVRARLLLMDGELDKARELLAGVARDLPQTGLSLGEAFRFASESDEILASPQRAAGEEAVIRLIRKDFTGALDELLRAGYWMDAAYLSEQVLTASELKAYVDANWPAGLAAKYQPPAEGEWEPMLAGGYAPPPPERLARDFRYLLGRRLAREGRRAEAAAYLPDEHRAALKSLDAHLAAGRDKRRSASARAGELFAAACVLRNQGMEVTGTEVDPDWTLVEGSYDLSWFVGDRLARSGNAVLKMSPEEAARVEKNRVEPRRFHYRFRAADLAWGAAKLLPNGDRKAEMLATAGNWIKYWDPEAADRFYKALVRCCRNTDLGREADDLRWFPEADACPARNGDDEE